MGFSPFIVPVALFVCIAATAIGLPLAKAFARRIDNQSRGPNIPPELQTRLERMEQALDSIAIEVERISEGQRFTTKLLSERSKTAEGLPERVK